MDYTTILLTRGLHTLISLEDADLSQYRWHALLSHHAVRRTPRPEHQSLLLHRVIMGRLLQRPLAPDEEVDHIDGDPLNNQRTNLRIATHTQNMRNRKLHRNNRSGHAGVYFNRQKQMWRATIRVDTREHHLGYFHTLDAAIAARQQAAQEYFGEWARSP